MAAWALRRASGTSLLVLGLPLLGIARLLPASGGGLWLRLVAASLVLFLPGALVARALRLRGASVAIAWTLATLTLALLVVFLVHTTIWIALVVLGAVALGALPFSFRAVSGPVSWSTLCISLAGLVFGIALWHVAGVVHGDALFHLGRVRKLDTFGSLHVRSVDEFADGGLHPGYAFPLWHGFLALVAKLAARRACESETASAKCGKIHGTSSIPSTTSEPPSTKAAQRRRGASPARGMQISAATAIAPPRANTSGRSAYLCGE